MAKPRALIKKEERAALKEEIRLARVKVQSEIAAAWNTYRKWVSDKEAELKERHDLMDMDEEMERDATEEVRSNTRR